MARRIIGSSGASGGGGGGSGISSDLPLVDSEVIDSSFSANKGQHACDGMSSKDNNKLVIFSWGNNNSNYYASARGIGVDNNGVITLSSQANTNNPSGVSTSTTFASPDYGQGACGVVGRQYYSGSYQLLSWMGWVDASGQGNVSLYSPGDYSASIIHPGGGTCVPFGLGTNQKRFSYGGYNNSSYGSFSNTVQDSSWNATILNYYSSSSYSGPCWQWHGDTTGRAGWVIDHRNASSGYYIQTIGADTNDTVWNGAMGYIGAFGSWQYQYGGFSYIPDSGVQNTKKVTFNTASGMGAWFTHNSGTAQSIDARVYNYPGNMSHFSSGKIFMPGKNLLCNVSGSSVSFYKITNPSSNVFNFECVGYVMTPVAGSQLAGVSFSNPGYNVKLAGDQLQYLVVGSRGGVATYDLASAIDLSEYAS